MKSLEYMGASEVTGRGLLAIVGRGSVYQVVLKAEESYVIHPRSASPGRLFELHTDMVVLAMSLRTHSPPLPLLHTG